MPNPLHPATTTRIARPPAAPPAPSPELPVPASRSAVSLHPAAPSGHILLPVVPHPAALATHILLPVFPHPASYSRASRILQPCVPVSCISTAMHSHSPQPCTSAPHSPVSLPLVCMQLSNPTSHSPTFCGTIVLHPRAVNSTALHPACFGPVSLQFASHRPVTSQPCIPQHLAPVTISRSSISLQSASLNPVPFQPVLHSPLSLHSMSSYPCSLRSTASTLTSYIPAPRISAACILSSVFLHTAAL